jgi:hypothetical protein
VTERTIALVDGRPFGCALLPRVGREVRRVLPGGDGSGQRDGRVPARVRRRLRPALDRLAVVGPEGPCEPRRGLARYHGAGEGVVEVGEELAGCPRSSRVAFADCDLPGWLRYARFPYRIENTPRRGSTGDPLADGLQPSEESVRQELARGWPELELGDPWARDLRRRMRRATLTLGVEEWALVEVHWQLGAGPCPPEGVRSGIFLRPAGATEWQAIAALPGTPVGAFHDGERVLALDVAGLVEPPAIDCRGAADCHAMGVALRDGPRSFDRRATVSYGFTGGNIVVHDGAPPLLRYDMDCTP